MLLTCSCGSSIEYQGLAVVGEEMAVGQVWQTAPQKLHDGTE